MSPFSPTAVRRTRRLLCDVIRFVRQLERVPRIQDPKKPYQVFLYGALVFSRRQADAILTLHPNHATESTFLHRTLMEAWVNARWIGLRNKNNRARRFLFFKSVQKVRMLEATPRHWHHDKYEQHLRRWRAVRKTFKHLFRIERKGKWIWAKTWAIDGTRQLENIADRIKDVAYASPDIQTDADTRLSFLNTMYTRLRWS